MPCWMPILVYPLGDVTVTLTTEKDEHILTPNYSLYCYYINKGRQKSVGAGLCLKMFWPYLLLHHGIGFHLKLL